MTIPQILKYHLLYGVHHAAHHLPLAFANGIVFVSHNDTASHIIHYSYAQTSSVERIVARNFQLSCAETLDRGTATACSWASETTTVPQYNDYAPSLLGKSRVPFLQSLENVQ